MSRANAGYRSASKARADASGDGAEKVELLKRLTDAETLERFLHTRHAGQKRFSLEGGESLIPLLDHVIARCAPHGAREIVLGMAHRGRINVLVNTLGRPLESLYEEPRQRDGLTPRCPGM